MQYLSKKWRALVRWLAADEFAAQEKMDAEKRAYLKEEYERKVADIEAVVRPMLAKIERHGAQFHSRPRPRILVQAIMGISDMLWMREFGQPERDYIARHLGHMIEHEVRNMKLVPVDDYDR